MLDTIIWDSLSGPQRHFSCGTDTGRRYAPGFSPIIAFPDAQRPDFAALRPFCTPGEQFYCDQWTGPAPADWSIEAEASMVKMIWDGGAPPAEAAGERPPATPLTGAHAPDALRLATLTHPGPFGLRTIELGDYFGIFDGDDLVAMAGERMHAGPYREISGVCTHPDWLGRGYARRLMLLLLRRQLARGQVPVLHVMSDNTRARGLYRSMGFRDYLETVVRVVSPRNGS